MQFVHTFQFYQKPTEQLTFNESTNYDLGRVGFHHQRIPQIMYKTTRFSETNWFSQYFYFLSRFHLLGRIIYLRTSDGPKDGTYKLCLLDRNRASRADASRFRFMKRSKEVIYLMPMTRIPGSVCAISRARLVLKLSSTILITKKKIPSHLFHNTNHMLKIGVRYMINNK